MLTCNLISNNDYSYKISEIVSEHRDYNGQNKRCRRFQKMVEKIDSSQVNLITDSRCNPPLIGMVRISSPQP